MEDQPRRQSSPLTSSLKSDQLTVPDPATLERRGSRVRFSASDLARKGSRENSDDEEETSITTPDGTLNSNLLGTNLSRYGRRGSLSPSVKSDNGSASAYKPRNSLSAKFESLDYNVVESTRFIQEKEALTQWKMQRAALMRWFVNFLVGVNVAIIAILVAICIYYISMVKFMAIYALLEDCDNSGCLVAPTVVWIVINAVLVFVGSYLVTYHAPQAAGSGIPQIKCYLNGIKLPGLLSLKTLLAKAGGVVLSVGGGLACGKEGPMIHSGAICASGLARGEFHCCGKLICKPSCFEALRSDEERRDFVVAGAASGVSAAFASPVGGVLFSLEEGASFLKQMLTWRMLFSSMVASLTLNILMSALKGHPENMSNPGLVSFGYIGDIDYKTFELPIFMVMAVIGGLSGALFVQINYKLTLFRRRVFTKNWMKVAEAVFVAVCSAIILMLLIYVVPNCAPIKDFHPTPHENTTLLPSLNHTLEHSNHHNVHRRSAQSDPEIVHPPGGSTSADGHDPYGDHGHGYVLQGFCPYGEHNRMADVLFKTPEGGLHAMLHGDVEEWDYGPLVVLLMVYHLLATWTYGLMVSSGVFIPSLLVGAVWGRIVGKIIMGFFPSVGTNIAKYVLIGAACQLGGTVRMTISLTVIIIECTGDVTFGIPIMLSLIIAKWIGDFFNPGIYDLHIEIMGIPLLPWDPPEMCYTVKARDVMSTPVVTFRTVEKIGRIMKIIEAEGCHNGFPVVDDFDPDYTEKMGEETYGRLQGFILKSQLDETLTGSGEEVTEDERNQTIDLRMHMDRAPFVIHEEYSLPRIFKLFRGLGLRHLVVTNDRNRVVGMITRLNVAQYHEETVKGHVKLERRHIV